MSATPTVYRRSEIEVTADAAAAILDSGLIPKTADNIAQIARLLKIEITDVRNAWTEQGRRGFTRPRLTGVAEETAIEPAELRTKAAPAGIDELIADGLNSTSARVRKTAERADLAVTQLRELLSTDKARQAAEAEVARLKQQLEEAQARLRSGDFTASSAPRQSNRGGVPSKPGIDRGLVREWAMAQGIPVAERGNISREVIEQYLEAHPSDEAT